MVEYYYEALEKQEFTSKRTKQNLDWMRQLLHEMLLLKLSQNATVKSMLPGLEKAVANQEITAFAAVRSIMDQF